MPGNTISRRVGVSSLIWLWSLSAEPPLPWIVVPHHAVETAVYEFPDGTVEREEITERWRELPAEGDVRRWRSSQTARQPGRTTHGWAIYQLDAHGWSWTQSRLPGSQPHSTGVPKLELPRDPTPGLVWSAVHDSPLGESLRTCRLDVEDSWCSGGVVTHCRTTRGAREILLRSHYCPGVGLVGQEGSAWDAGQLTFSYRSTGRVVDHVACPERPGVLPVPVPSDVMHPGE